MELQLVRAGELSHEAGRVEEGGARVSEAGEGPGANREAVMADEPQGEAGGAAKLEHPGEGLEDSGTPAVPRNASVASVDEIDDPPHEPERLSTTDAADRHGGQHRRW